MSNKKINILIADDHPLFREALSYIVESSFSNHKKNAKCDSNINTLFDIDKDIFVSHTVDYFGTIEKLNESNIDWLFLDLNMPNSNGLNGLMNIRKQFPKLPIVIISANESPEVIQSCFAYEITGYITKSTQPDDIEFAIERILSGEIFSPIPLTDNKVTDKKQGLKSLTSAQLTILTHIGIGKLNKQIAEELGITEATVKAHITQIYKKLNVKNRTKAALIAQQAQLVD